MTLWMETTAAGANDMLTDADFRKSLRAQGRTLFAALFIVGAYLIGFMHGRGWAVDFFLNRFGQ